MKAKKLDSDEVSTTWKCLFIENTHSTFIKMRDKGYGRYIICFSISSRIQLLEGQILALDLAPDQIQMNHRRRNLEWTVHQRPLLQVTERTVKIIF